MKIIALTDRQAARLSSYIQTSKCYRQGELESCESLSLEIKDDGTLRFPKMAANAAWWRETDSIMSEILMITKASQNSDEGTNFTEIVVEMYEALEESLGLFAHGVNAMYKKGQNSDQEREKARAIEQKILKALAKASMVKEEHQAAKEA